MNRKRKAALLLLGLLVGVHEGHVAFWEDGELKLVTPMPADLLPAADRKALERGVVIDDSYSLSQALEDYLS